MQPCRKDTVLQGLKTCLGCGARQLDGQVQPVVASPPRGAGTIALAAILQEFDASTIVL